MTSLMFSLSDWYYVINEHLAQVKRFITSVMDDKLVKHQTLFDTLLTRHRKELEEVLKKPLELQGRINDFDIIKTLGTGSFGRVLLVRHKNANKNYAMKVMEKRNIVRTKQVAHTIAEIRMLRALNFEFIVHMDYFFKDNVYLYLVMPFISGGEMFTHLRKQKKFDESLCKFYGAQVVLAFEYMHKMGALYRDLKPENILIDKDGYIKLTDLGFCKKIDDQRTYTLCGTPEYLAPEIILSQGYNYAVDWWALGILIYEMAAGYPPFYAKDPMKIYEKIVSGKYLVPGHFSKPIKDLLANIIQVDRTKRFGNLKNGVKDIKNHEWFKNVDYDLILDKKIKPSYKPLVTGEGDTSNFEYFEDVPLRTSDHDEFGEQFDFDAPYTVTPI